MSLRLYGWVFRHSLRDHALTPKGPDMNKPKKNRLVWIIAIFIFCLLCIVVSFLATYIFQLRLEPTYHLEDVKMVSCKSFETQMCSADTVTFYSAGEDNVICVAWVEVGRKQYDSLVIVIYDKSNKAVFSYEDVQSPVLWSIK